MTAAESGDVGEPAARLAGSAVARAAAAQVPAVRDAAVRDAAAARDADAAVAELYAAHYRSLVGLAALLLRDQGTAEEVVQDAFVAMHSGWRRLRDTDQALGYLRRSVINGSRSVLRHRAVIDRTTQPAPPDAPSAEQDAMTLLERSAMVAALDRLPLRQREALVLRFYADMSPAQIASAMGISVSAVKGHTARALSSLRGVLEDQT
jgi:RNA polymerase sigma-70 factor (sigma-E family)